MPETSPRAGSAANREIGDLAVSPVRHSRPVQDDIPPSPSQRNRLLRVVREYLGAAGAVPPLSADELHLHADNAVRLARVDGRYHKYAAIVVNNEVWRERLAGIPYHRRLLLLPQCLRDQSRCRADLDEFGLVCMRCGECLICDLQTEAERLGYVVLVAEGTTIVTALIRAGRIDAVVGVSCLSVLERVFPHISAAAVPGVAVPLLQDGCRDTSVDLDALWEAIYLTSDDRTRRLDLNGLRREVESWFTPECVAATLGQPDSQTERIAQAWLAGPGKRWRPFLAACAFQAWRAGYEGSSPGREVRDPGPPPLPEELRDIAVAVECFHKASLVHDDIEDGDPMRYGQKTLHEQYGVPVALNVGDFLLGEGYRMIGACGAPEARKMKMVCAAAEGHRKLSLGQGAELCWRRSPRPLSVRQVLEIFRQKTAPAFDVALRLGATYAGADEEAREVLGKYSDSVGIAYQIRDDIHDFHGQADPGDGQAMRPSLLLAIAHERATGRAKQLLEGIWRASPALDTVAEQIANVLAELKVEAAAAALLEFHKQQAIRSLQPLDNANLKGLLRRVVGKIFDDMEATGCCREYKAGNAAGRPVGAEPAA